MTAAALCSFGARLRKKGGEPQRRTPFGESPQLGPAQSREDAKLKCAVCRSLVSYESLRIEVDGKHSHTFFNPSGLVFEIHCFSQAEGCAPAGPKSAEFTWFPGFAWQVGLCIVCGAHLGWRWRNDEGYGFFGLLPGMLKSDMNDCA